MVSGRDNVPFNAHLRVFGKHMTKLASLLPLLIASAAFANDNPVNNGLALRLDAREQSMVRTAAHLPALANLLPVDRWLDTSGNARHALQTVASHRPVFKA